MMTISVRLHDVREQQADQGYLYCFRTLLAH